MTTRLKTLGEIVLVALIGIVIGVVVLQGTYTRPVPKLPPPNGGTDRGADIIHKKGGPRTAAISVVPEQALQFQAVDSTNTVQATVDGTSNGDVTTNGNVKTPAGKSVTTGHVNGYINFGLILASGGGASSAVQTDQFQSNGGAYFAGQTIINATITPTAFSGTRVDNYNPTGLSTAARIDQDASSATTITGITAPTGSIFPTVTGTLLTFRNISAASNITFSNADGNSAGSAQFSLPGGVNWVLTPGGSFTLQATGGTPGWRFYPFSTTDFPSLTVDGAATVNGTTTVNGIEVFGSPQTPATLSSGNNNNYNPTNWSTSSRWSLTGNAAGSTLTGFTATVDGDTKALSNLGTSIITITNQDTNSTAANRTVTPANGQPYVIGIGSTVTIQYSTANSRWYIKAASDSFSPTFGDISLQSQAPVATASGLTSNWAPFTPNQTYVIAQPNAGTTGQILTTDSVVDGLVSDGQGSTPIGGALRVICQSAISHAQLFFLIAESSASSTGNQFYINADGNTAGTGFSIGHRQCALFVYNQDRSKWQPVATSDGVLRRLSIDGYWNDTSLGAGPIAGYDAGGTAGTHLCGLTRLRWASAGATTINNWVACNPGDIKVVQVFSGGITLKNNVSTGGAAFFLPGGVDKVLVNDCRYTFIYDGPNPGWYILTTSSTSGLAC
jgi:hypothetical protein